MKVVFTTGECKEQALNSSYKYLLRKIKKEYRKKPLNMIKNQKQQKE